jgi:hypothetical protein
MHPWFDDDYTIATTDGTEFVRLDRKMQLLAKRQETQEEEPKEQETTKSALRLVEGGYQKRSSTVVPCQSFGMQLGRNAVPSEITGAISWS